MTNRAIIKLCIVATALVAVGLCTFLAFNYIYEVYRFSYKKEPISVSLDQLISNPSAYNKKEIVTKGYLKTISRDGVENVLHMNEYENSNDLMNNSIRVSLTDEGGEFIEVKMEKYDNLSKQNGNLIIVEGLFLSKRFPTLLSNVDKSIYNISGKPTLFIKHYEPYFPITSDK